HARPHSETGEAPQARLAAGQPRLPDPALLKEAFSWSVIRQVRKTATVSVEGNVYSVDPFLTGRKIECVFDPFDMSEMTVYWQGRFLGDPAFRRIIAAGSSITTGQPLAVIRWNAAVHALQTGHLPCSGSEQAILKIAASLAEPGIAISLRDCLGNLDQRNIT